MSRIGTFLVLMGLMWSFFATPLPVAGATGQASDSVFDLADVPLPVQNLPEDGFQVLNGGFLDLETAATWIAEPRGRSTSSMQEALVDAGWSQTYVLDHVLLEDRAYATSDILSLVQTNVFLFPDSAAAEDMLAVMADYSSTESAEEVEPAIIGSTTVHLTSQSGDTLRTVFQHERTAVEVVSLETFAFVDADTHRVVVADTLDRLQQLQEGTSGVSPRAARLTDGEALADFSNSQQTGVHHLYRIRDGVVQPAAGELRAGEVEGIADGIVALYQASEGLDAGNGTGFMSTWIGEFESSDVASAFVTGIASGNPSEVLVDPYFGIAREESATPQGIEGLYRVTGILDGQPYSGTLEIRQEGTYVVAVGFRTFGSTLAPVDVTSRVMDHQLACLAESTECAPIDAAELLSTPSATPVGVSGTEPGDGLMSEEFGWSVDIEAGNWTVNEQFSESGYDFAELQSGNSLVTLESVINQHGDPQQCVIDELDALQELESSAVIDLGSDDDAEAPAGSEPGHAWALYTVEPLADERADQEYTIRIDCYTIIEGGANLIVTHRAPRSEWETEREKGDELRSTLSLPTGYRPGGILAFATHDWRYDEINKHWIDFAA